MVYCINNKYDFIRVTLYLSLFELFSLLVQIATFSVAVFTWPEIIERQFSIFVMTIVALIYLFVNHIMQLYGVYYGNYYLLVITGWLRVMGIIFAIGLAIRECVLALLTWTLSS
jgi:hypothetical protein